MKRFGKILLILFVLLLIAAFFGYDKYKAIYGKSVEKTDYLYIPSGSSYTDLVNLLDKNDFVNDIGALEWVAGQKKYDKGTIRAGRFQLKEGWSNNDLINHLRVGKQAPVNLVLNYQRLRSDVAGKAARFIEADSMEILSVLNDKVFVEEQGYDYETALCAVIPNTYQFFWNTDGEGFYKRMVKESNKFWAKDDRLAKAEKLGLTPKEVYTLASIVEKETNKNDEKKRVAGVYLNRLKKGMLLQADPTLVFALKDFTIRRVLNRHKEVDSKYNTYKYAGLPPGPIALASIPSIDAVLNAEQHKYYYFCAKADGSGYHAFAKNLSGHNANARRYHRYLRSIGR